MDDLNHFKMSITIFGGTGETGLQLIQKALANGHNITVYARTPSKIPFQNEKLKIIKGELTETEKIEMAIKNTDTVISVLGPDSKTKGLVIADGIKNIIASMEKLGVRRLIAVATPSYKDSNDKFQFGFAFGVFMIKTLLKDSYRNIVETGKLISNSNLDWTIIRLPMLSSKPAKGKLNIGYTGDGKINLFSLTRADLTEFLIQQIDDKSLFRKSPVISN
jgi:Trk K+ transport system NAD-binding subunit